MAVSCMVRSGKLTSLGWKSGCPMWLSRVVGKHNRNAVMESPCTVHHKPDSLPGLPLEFVCVLLVLLNSE